MYKEINKKLFVINIVSIIEKDSEVNINNEITIMDTLIVKDKDKYIQCYYSGSSFIMCNVFDSLTSNKKQFTEFTSRAINQLKEKYEDGI